MLLPCQSTDSACPEGTLICLIRKGKGWKPGFFCVLVSPGAQPFLEQIENSAEALQDYGISVVKVKWGRGAGQAISGDYFCRASCGVDRATSGTDSSGTPQESRCWQTRASRFNPCPGLYVCCLWVASHLLPAGHRQVPVSQRGLMLCLCLQTQRSRSLAVLWVRQRQP